MPRGASHEAARSEGPRRARAALLLGATVALGACRERVAAVYGAPPPPQVQDAGARLNPNAPPRPPQDQGSIGEIYGAPPPPVDAGPQGDGSAR
ncbi:MAG: hypothetical protein JNK72_26430 [Myxococcales bacterium]|nr:hypothetical protein [Myxococcales bacterium]